MQRTTYETDFYAWTQQQAALLQAEDLEKLDLPNLAEEIESMGKRDRKEVASRLKVLLIHLLKWKYQPQKNKGSSWRDTIRTQRNEIADEFDYSPSLRRELSALIAYAYPRARRDAAIETKLALATFPADCPWTGEEILGED
ncbi:MAG: DUF29 domain-containing protein [Chloroflexota bacterium]|nr:DUF29 domain-containing protein [Chloroflexota bacterium]